MLECHAGLIKLARVVAPCSGTAKALSYPASLKAVATGYFLVSALARNKISFVVIFPAKHGAVTAAVDVVNILCINYRNHISAH